MKIYIIPALALTSWFAISEPETAVLILLFSAIVAVVYHFYLKRKQEIEKMEWYARRIKNIYVSSEHPNDTTVIKRCRDHIDWLIKSGNKLRGATKSVKVFGVIYRDLDVVQFYLEESPNNGKVRIAKKRINVDNTGANAVEQFGESEDPEEMTYQKRLEAFKTEKEMERAKEVRFNITDKDIEGAKDKNENFWETEWLNQE